MTQSSDLDEIRAILNQTVQLQQINAQQIAALREMVAANQEQVAHNTEAITRLTAAVEELRHHR